FILHSSLLLFLSCTGHPKEVRIEGEFEHLEQGEFLIYSTDEGLDRLDTLRLQDGRFAYTLPTVQTATLHILYPNQSELVVFGNPGSDLVISGDAQNLSEVEVTGDEDNETYTQFRLETIGKSDEETKSIARDYILENPTLAMSRYLFTTYFLCDAEASVPEVTELYDSLSRACPDDLALSKLSTHIRSLGKLRVGNPLPDFSLTLKPGHGGNGAVERTIKKADYKGKPLLIAFWASWKGGSRSALYRARRLRREMKAKGKDIELIAYSLDGDARQLARTEERDTVDYASYCDFRTLASPLVQQWGIRELPFFILVTPDGRIAATGTDWMRDIQPKASEL
ncbi:MAG: AhpC/TSA family protein, partial [Bacteroidaceae bacterium]|nr:AhpC/TSA family protein [Bacteroidaceae bacterium]